MKNVIGLTGEIGCGKSYIAGLFVKYGKELGKNVVDIDVDRVAIDLLVKNTKMREELKLTLGTDERAALSKMVFSEKKSMDKLNAIMKPYVTEECARLIEQEKDGLILINSALVVEAGFFETLCNCRTLMVLTPVDKQIQNLMARGYLFHESLNRTKAQMSSVQKALTILQYSIEKDKPVYLNYLHNYDPLLEHEIKYQISIWAE